MQLKISYSVDRFTSQFYERTRVCNGSLKIRPSYLLVRFNRIGGHIVSSLSRQLFIRIRFVEAYVMQSDL